MWRGRGKNACLALVEKSKKKKNKNLSDKLGIVRRIILQRTLKK